MARDRRMEKTVPTVSCTTLRAGHARRFIVFLLLLCSYGCDRGDAVPGLSVNDSTAIPSPLCISSVIYWRPLPYTTGHASYQITLNGDPSLLRGFAGPGCTWRILSDSVVDSLQFNFDLYSDAVERGVIGIGTWMMGYPSRGLFQARARVYSDLGRRLPPPPPPPNEAYSLIELIREPGIRVQVTDPATGKQVILVPCRIR